MCDMKDSIRSIELEEGYKYLNLGSKAAKHKKVWDAFKSEVRDGSNNDTIERTKRTRDENHFRVRLIS
jgi:hypothetical protein